MNEVKQQSSKALSSKLVALVESGFGIMLLLMVLALNIRTRELKDLTMLVSGLLFILLIYFGCKAAGSETPKWSDNAKRLNGIGTAVFLSGGTIGISFSNLVLGIPMILVGLMLILISALHPSSRLEKMTSHKEEDGAESGIEWH